MPAALLLPLIAAEVVVAVPAAAGPAPRVLYLDRCPADCAIAPGAGGDDAAADRSALVTAPATLRRLPRLDLVWADVVICVQETFGPYGIEIALVEPAPDTPYVEVKVAGRPEELGLPADALGAATIAADCAPRAGALGFAFGNRYDLAAEPGRALDLCYTVVHAAGHLLGLEDADECLDVMHGPAACAARPWFVDLEVGCAGPDGPAPCACRAAQRSHQVLADLLGPGTEPAPPRVAIAAPAPGARTGARVEVVAEVTRGRALDRVELRVDGEVAATAAGGGGATHRLAAAVPPGEVTLEVRAYDDRGRMGGARVAIVAGDGGGCAAGGGAGAGGALVLAALALLTRRGRSSPRAAAPRRAPRRS